MEFICNFKTLYSFATSEREDLIDGHRFRSEQSSLNFQSESVSCIITYVIINGGTRAQTQIF